MIPQIDRDHVARAPLPQLRFELPRPRLDFAERPRDFAPGIENSGRVGFSRQRFRPGAEKWIVRDHSLRPRRSAPTFPALF